jgi:ankyrin repeat protein
MMRSAAAIDFLCQQNADVTLSDHTGMTPLHWCVKTANTAAAKNLITHGAEVNVMDSAGRTPLYLLGIDGSPVLEMAGMLIQAGGRLNGKALPPLSGRPKDAQQRVRTWLNNCQ